MTLYLCFMLVWSVSCSVGVCSQCCLGLTSVTLSIFTVVLCVPVIVLIVRSLCLLSAISVYTCSPVIPVFSVSACVFLVLLVYGFMLLL